MRRLGLSVPKSTDGVRGSNHAAENVEIWNETNLERLAGEKGANSVRNVPQGLNVVYQDFVYIEPVHSIVEGYGKGGKLKRAFHFPTNPATAAGLNLLTLGGLRG
jgi:hypothetical protein